MASVYCSAGHTNLAGNRFCARCGEKLNPVYSVQAGMILGDRYRIQRELGQGGFGRTYLAEDIHRFNEPCVLKEFAPQVQDTAALQKAKELFEREAGVLYRLQHPQIPRFREMFQTTFDGQGHLFLVQDYVEGHTYRYLLETRRSQGHYFTEAEAVQLLYQLLPVLAYLHSVGVIHRDISPDNLMLRDRDQLPVLIDFGGVKQVAAVAASEYVHSAKPTPTRLGKVGYAPEEQMQVGTVFPHSDLYALAMTVLVLLTGKDPQDIWLEPAGQWRQQVQLSPAIAQILQQMLASNPRDRVQSATAVLQALAGEFPIAPTPASIPSPSPLPSPSPVPRPAPISPTVAVPSPVPVASQSSGLGSWLAGLVLLLLLGGGTGLAWQQRDRWLPWVMQIPQAETPSTDAATSPEEQQRKAALKARRTALAVDLGFLTQLTNDTFYQRYPEWQGKSLTTDPADAEGRAGWDAIADEWLTLFEQTLSAEARRRLGSYTNADAEARKQAVNQLYIGSRALNDLTDARFYDLFPQQGTEFINQPIGQVWQAIATDAVTALQEGRSLEQIRFASGSFSQQLEGSLAVGDGKVYVASLQQGQLMRVSLQANSPDVFLSIYPPRPTAQTPALLEDASEKVWSGELNQSGYYEFVVVNRGTESIGYRLNIAIDNVTTTPVEAAPEAPEAKD